MCCFVCEFIVSIKDSSGVSPDKRRSGFIGTLGCKVVGLDSDDGIISETVALKSSLTTPDAITVQWGLRQLRERRVSDLAVEVSSHALDQDRVADVSVDTAIFTNLSRDHLDYHGNLAAYADAKRKLFEMPLNQRCDQHR